MIKYRIEELDFLFVYEHKVRELENLCLLNSNTGKVANLAREVRKQLLDRRCRSFKGNAAHLPCQGSGYNGVLSERIH